MKKMIIRLLRAAGTLMHRAAGKLEASGGRPDPADAVRAESLRRWFADEGDKTHRLNYPLPEKAVVFDLGGYEGEWASQILGLYGPEIYIFEPYSEYYNNIRNRFLRNRKIQVFQFGLSGVSHSARLSLADNSSSIFHTDGESVAIELVRAQTFFTEHGIERVDLMKVNIEGGEYDLLDHMIETGLIGRVIDLQVQFHDFVPDAASRLQAIRESLARTHRLTYQYEHVWENWRLEST
jgi:FkbM family methyltransferase